jgi:hypothetical protein
MARKAPRWFKDQLAAEKSRYFRGQVGEAQAAKNLAEQILASSDQRFAVSIIADYVRPQIDPPISRPPKIVRQAEAAQFRDEGLSLRKIAERLGVNEKTIRNDLARWDAERANVAELRNPGAESRPRIPQPDSAPAAVIPFRRTS